MSAFNKILIGVLAAQIVLALVVHTGTEATESIPRPAALLPGLDSEQITRVAIYKARAPEATDADTAAAAQPNAEADQPAIDLRRQGTADSATWTLASHYDHPALMQPVEDLLGKLIALQSAGPAVTSEARHEQLEVAGDHYRRKVVIETADGTVRTLLIGKPSRARQSFVRIDGQKDVHAVNDISESGLNLVPSAWVDTNYLGIPSSQVMYMSVRNRQGTYEFQRNESGRWELVEDGAPYPMPPDRKFNAVAADIWVKDMLRLTLTEPADPARQIDVPLATVTLRLKPKAPAGEAAEAGAAPEGGADQPGADSAAPAGAEEVAGQPAGEASPEPAEERVIEIGAKDADLYYVRISGLAHAAMVRNPRLGPIVDMRDEVVLIPVEK
jgi:Domain of unknown function (DUF4340)